MAESRHWSRTMALNRGRIVLTVLLFAAAWLFLSIVPVSAHKVTIVGWVEGDTVHTQSNFTGGRKAIDSTVVVYDGQGGELLKGKTNQEGAFSFKVPKKTDLKIVLKASMGHMAEWKIPAEEVISVANATDKGSNAVVGLEGAGEEAPPEGRDTGVALSREEVQALIDASLDRKLAPIIDMVTKQGSGGATASQIIGGLGYILGLVGVALYVASRRNKGGGRR